MRVPPILLLLTAVSCGIATSSEETVDETVASAAADLKVPAALTASELTLRLDKPSIRALQTWVDDATFELKWQAMLATPIAFFGATDSSFHLDLGSLPAKRLPGGETLCHGDPKLDNFGWTLVKGAGVFSNNDFDDSGYCPAAADILRDLVATELLFADAALDEAALGSYLDTLDHPSKAVAVDPSSEPTWSDVRTKGLAKDTSGGKLVLGGEVQAATAGEVSAILALAAGDARFPKSVLDVARNVRVDGGSAALRRFWLLTEDASGTRSILELKELGVPGTEFGRHSQTLDGPDRFDVLKPYWWSSKDKQDHFQVELFGARFVARDRLTRTNPKPDKMTHAELKAMLQAEASLLALKHAQAWGKVKTADLGPWLRTSAAVLSTRWRSAYLTAGGK